MGEPLVAAWVLAYVWLLSCVCPQVCSQVEVQGELLATNSALELLLSSMDELMPFEFRVVKELFVATRYWACVEPLTVCHQMLSQG